MAKAKAPRSPNSADSLVQATTTSTIEAITHSDAAATTITNNPVGLLQMACDAPKAAAADCHSNVHVVIQPMSQGPRDSRSAGCMPSYRLAVLEPEPSLRPHRGVVSSTRWKSVPTRSGG